ncbi:unnamed protein product [Discula destructiva]
MMSTATAEPTYQELDCKLIDGTTISGWFFPVKGPAPVIIMTPGMNCVKRILLPKVAKGFQDKGLSAYVYDPRSTGESGGLPRNQIDPLRQAEDLADIVTQIRKLPNVDPKRVVLWGMSFGGTVSGVAATFDHRVAAVIMVCPILEFYKPEKRAAAYARIIADREAQLLDVAMPEVFHTFTAKGDNLIGMAGDGGPGGLEAFWFMNIIVERGGPSARDHITMLSNQKMAEFYPKQILPNLTRTPVMMIIPEKDVISPPEVQKEVFDTIPQANKQVLFVKGRGHLNVLTGKGYENVLEEQLKFLLANTSGLPLAAKL